jgi:phosphoribosylanthranilate isomerase
MKIKVCGMKDGDNISAVARLQPDYMGFIFYPKSKRFFTGTLPELSSEIDKTAVYVNEDLYRVLDRVKEYNFGAIQLHGDESASYCRELKKALSPAVQLIKAFSMHQNFDMTRLMDYQAVCDFFLFDTKGKERGGTGQVFDWNILKSYDLKHPFFLSGGIGLDQIDNLKEFFKTKVSNYCHAVDLNSKFEDLPGLKRIRDLELFIKEIKSL